MSELAGFSGKTVLVTGGLGFIGSNFALSCVANGGKVRILDCALPGSGANPVNVEALDGIVDVIEGDVRDPGVIGPAVDGVDVILHSAAQTSHTRSMADALVTLDVNVRGTLQLLEAVRESGTDPKIVHVGTTTQLGPMVHEPINELHPEFPRDVYSATMVGSEKFVLIYAHAHGLRATVVRLCNTYGPRAAIHSPDLGFVNFFIGLGLRGREMTIYGDGKQLRSLLHVEDAVDALARAALSEEADGEVYLASSKTTFTVAEIAEAVAEHVGGSVAYVDWPTERKAIEVGNAVIDSSKIKASLAWSPRIELDDGLISTARYYGSRLEQYLNQSRIEP